MLIGDAYIMAGLIVVACAALLLAHGVIPSLVASHDVPPGAAKLRPVFYAVFAVALGVGLLALARTLQLAALFESGFYPRFGY